MSKGPPTASTRDRRRYACPMRTVTATRYVTPLREGGSLPAIVEADDDGMYVLKFRGAGQGRVRWCRAGLRRHRAGTRLPFPELVFMELDAERPATKATRDPGADQGERGPQLALDYLPGAVNFDPVAEQPSAGLSSAIVGFDAFTSNVDRTVRNPNLLVWHGQLTLIDHGASLYFHHGWDGDTSGAGKPFPLIREHVLLPWASELGEADERLGALLPPERLAEIVALVPDAWLQGRDAFGSPQQQRDAYAGYLQQRLALPRAFVQEAIRARA